MELIDITTNSPETMRNYIKKSYIRRLAKIYKKCNKSLATLSLAAKYDQHLNNNHIYALVQDEVILGYIIFNPRSTRIATVYDIHLKNIYDMPQLVTAILQPIKNYTVILLAEENKELELLITKQLGAKVYVVPYGII